MLPRGEDGDKMSRAEKLAYARGYNRGRQNQWPAHMPPSPPEPVVRRLIEAVAKIRGEADGLQATFGPDDEIVKVFDRMIEEADAAAEAVDRWLRSQPDNAAAGDVT